MKVNRRKLLSLLGMSPAVLAGSGVEAADKRRAAEDAPVADLKLAALSPKGTPPPVNRFPMAARTNSTLDGKTVYLVDTGFMAADVMIQQVAAWFQQNMPSVKIVSRKKAGTYPEDDPKLWAEIKANAVATIMAIGH
jgi:hypothetical protein